MSMLRVFGSGRCTVFTAKLAHKIRISDLMTTPLFAPPLSSDAGYAMDLQRQGFAVLGAAQLVRLAGLDREALERWPASWDDLPADQYLRDGGHYRRRRHSSFVLRDGVLQQMPHRPHWQPVSYNALHGGMLRHFEPVTPALVAQPDWRALLIWLGGVCSQLRGVQPWFMEAHQFRIDTTDGIGRPTPEGAHRDGVDLVAVVLVRRHGIKGGETRVFAADRPEGLRFTLTEPWSVLLLDDMRVIHESTPILPQALEGLRDTLVVTVRAGSFQELPEWDKQHA